MTTGLYIGKFAPPHAGHDLVIQRALQECDDVLLFVYNSAEWQEQHPLLTLSRRALWLAEQYPEVHIVLGHNPPADDFSFEGDMRHAAYMHRLLPCSVQRVYGGEPWLHNIAFALHAEAVDVQRDFSGISATKVRQDPAAWRNALQPQVYRWMQENYGKVENE